MKIMFEPNEEERILDSIKERLEEMNPREVTEFLNFLGLLQELCD